MEPLGHILKPLTIPEQPSCRRCGAAISGELQHYCEACFEVAGPEVMRALEVDVEEKVPGWEQAAGELERLRRRAGISAGESSADRSILGLLLGAGEPVALEILAKVLERQEGDVEEELGWLRTWLGVEKTGLALEERRAGWELVTDPAIAARVRELKGMRRRRQLTDYARETLFILMRKGPCVKAEIEELRKIADVSPVLRTLKKEGLVIKAGKRETPGKPTLYRATPEAFRRFPDLDKLAAELMGQVKAAENAITEGPDRAPEAGVEERKVHSVKAE